MTAPMTQVVCEKRSNFFSVFFLFLNLNFLNVQMPKELKHDPKTRKQGVNWAVTIPNPEHLDVLVWEERLDDIQGLKFAIVGREHGAPKPADSQGFAGELDPYF